MATAPRFWRGETLTYGLEGGDLCGQLTEVGTLRVEGIDFTLPLAGRHNASNFLAALAIAKILGIDFHKLQQGLAVNMPQGRSQRYLLANDILILDETYNAGLESMLAALQLLKETPGTRHLAILGTMKELGDRSREFHDRVGESVKKLNLDRLLVLVGDPESEAIALGAKDIPTDCFSSPEELVTKLTEIVQPGDRLLFKASHSVGLNRVVEQFRNKYEQ
jgi:UDP-N-acetylmuramoyl-tripeptide--D-alanyl-D-alanine ligase